MIMKKKKMNSNFGNYYKKISNRRSFICGIKSTTLSKKEVSFLKLHKPWGIILFSRNIRSIYQTKNLTDNIKKIFKDKNYPILIDEEGGKVSRLSELFSTKEFSQYFFGLLYEKNNKNGKLIYKYYLETICNILNDLGININTIPVMDLLQNSTHQVIKSRAYSYQTKTIKTLGKFCVSFLKKKKIASVSKHAPGHGCSNSDSHLNLPIVYKKKSKLYKEDFSLFKNLSSNFMMTAHILYKNVDFN